MEGEEVEKCHIPMVNYMQYIHNYYCDYDCDCDCDLESFKDGIEPHEYWGKSYEFENTEKGQKLLDDIFNQIDEELEKNLEKIYKKEYSNIDAIVDVLKRNTEVFKEYYRSDYCIVKDYNVKGSVEVLLRDLLELCCGCICCERHTKNIYTTKKLETKEERVYGEGGHACMCSCRTTMRWINKMYDPANKSKYVLEEPIVEVNIEPVQQVEDVKL